MQKHIDKIKETAKNTFIVKILKWALASSSFALLLSIVFFWWQMINSSNGLKTIEQKIIECLSTRYIGIFPDYLAQIDELLANANPEKPVIIFEDVLYYGILSGAEDFKNVARRLINLADDSCKITIAYYDINGRIFRRMIQEQRISTEYLVKLDSARAEMIKQNARNNIASTQNSFAIADSIVSERFFVENHKRNTDDLKRTVERYRKPLYNNLKDTLEIDKLFIRIDSIKTNSLGKAGDPIQNIKFKDFLDMYIGISRELIDIYSSHGIDLIPLNEYLTMSCWLNNNKAVFAFPSKYNTDEIGFATQDPVFSEYINTMLEGVKSNRIQ
ncbi:MAG: hypothetical protein LBR13_03560 [Dysgonamonadaceae bacterium]|jgi:hypothetical protein|nr:hypothetical protein [Dysgonamonadaceae bacterium]